MAHMLQVAIQMECIAPLWSLWPHVSCAASTSWPFAPILKMYDHTTEIKNKRLPMFAHTLYCTV